MADALRWDDGTGGPPTLEQLRELAKRELQRPWRPQPKLPLMVSPDQFRYFVKAGVMDEEGRFIL